LLAVDAAAALALPAAALATIAAAPDEERGTARTPCE